MKKAVKYFVTEKGTSPFEDWFENLDKLAKAIVVRAIQKVAQGGAKKSVKSLRGGLLFEIRIPHGPGYRVYFAKDGNQIITLLVGGIKRTQNRDIEKAKKIWRNYGK